MNNPIWRFPTTFEGGGIGFNDGGTQLFKDDSIQSLAREVCQNSIDAKHKTNSSPAEVEFHTFNISKNQFPGYDFFHKIIKDEVKYCTNFYKNNKNAINYYQDALDALESEFIACLRISDFNTTGLTIGNDINNNNWANLVVHSGTNDKKEDDGGSFGLGKNAMYACSKFGTLFFSTHTDEGDKRSECMAKLSCFDNSNGDVVHGLGFYGNYETNNSPENDKPIPSLCYLDRDFNRRENETGTDIYILGFELPITDIISEGNNIYSKFEIDIAAAIIDSYFESILSNKLIVRINDIEINKENIFEVFDKIYSDSEHYTLFNTNTVDYLNIMRSNDNVAERDICIMDPSVPDAKLRIKLDPSFHNRIAMVRNTGMKIFDKGNFRTNALFSGILVLNSKEVNGYFKKMENPAHDGWMIDRIKGDPSAKSKYDRMLSQIKDIIIELSDEISSEELDAVGVGEFLPDDFTDGNEDNLLENIIDDFTEEVIPIERKELPIDFSISGEENGDDSVIRKDGTPDESGEYEAEYPNGDPNESNGGVSSTNNASDGDNKVSISKEFIIKNVKSTHFIDKDGYYTFIITSPKDMNNCKFEVLLAGEQGNFTPKISNAFREKKLFGNSGLNVDENKIEIGKILKNEKTKIKFKLDDNEMWSLEVNIYEN